MCSSESVNGKHKVICVNSVFNAVDVLTPNFGSFSNLGMCGRSGNQYMNDRK